MNNEKMTVRQSVCLLTMFLFGNSAMFQISASGSRDAWLSLLIATAVAIPMVMIYSRIISLYPGKTFFEIVYFLLGKIGGFIVSIFLMWYAMHLAALLQYILTEFGMVISLPNPPYFLMVTFVTLAAIYLIKSGGGVLGKWSIISFIAMLAIVVVSFALAMKDADLKQLLPMLRSGPESILKGASQYLAFPFLESIVFLPVLSAWGDSGKSRKIYLCGILIAAGMLMTTGIRNLLLLGEPLISQLYFPFHSASKLLHIGEFLNRLEESVSIFMLLSGITKLAVCLYAAAQGLSYILGEGSSVVYKLIMPVGVFCLALSTISTEDMMDMGQFTQIYPAYAVLFEFVIPIVIWITAEIKSRRQKKKPAAA